MDDLKRQMHFQPMPLLKRAAPFDDPDWIYELKMDGFRALAIVEKGRAQLLSRNGNPFASFSASAKSISDCLPNVRAVIVAKQKSAPYVTDREQSTWYKILNREYSQKDGREELLERERHQEPYQDG